MSLSPAWTFKGAIQPALGALRRYWAPFLLIQICAAGLVVAYYFIPEIQAFADAIGRVKLRYGLLFSAVGGFVAGGLIPEVAKLATGRVKRLDGQWVKDALFAGLIFSVVAVEVDLFYRLQVLLFGTGVDPATVVAKMLFDMGLFSPLLCIPSSIWIADWRGLGFRSSVRQIGVGWYRDRVLAALFPGWAFWIPFLLCLYALPYPLQLPMSLLGEAAWSLLFIVIATRPPEGT